MTACTQAIYKFFPIYLIKYSERTLLVTETDDFSQSVMSQIIYGDWVTKTCGYHTVLLNDPNIVGLIAKQK